jgi:hypothetical protein
MRRELGMSRSSFSVVFAIWSDMAPFPMSRISGCRAWPCWIIEPERAEVATRSGYRRQQHSRVCDEIQYLSDKVSLAGLPGAIAGHQPGHHNMNFPLSVELCWGRWMPAICCCGIQ